jgi:hypothetical protein
MCPFFLLELFLILIFYSDRSLSSLCPNDHCLSPTQAHYSLPGAFYCKSSSLLSLFFSFPLDSRVGTLYDPYYPTPCGFGFLQAWYLIFYGPCTPHPVCRHSPSPSPHHRLVLL